MGGQVLKKKKSQGGTGGDGQSEGEQDDEDNSLDSIANLWQNNNCIYLP